MSDMFAKFKERRGAGLAVELLMIVVGINIALWFEGWFEEQGEREAEQVYLRELLSDLEIDQRALASVIEANTGKAERLAALVDNYAALPDAAPEDQARAIFEPSSYSFFYPSDVTYESMLQSGDFRLLSDPDTKTGLLRLSRRWDEIATLQRNYLQALDDEYIPLMMQQFDLSELRVADPALYENQTFKNFFPYALQDTARLVEVYEQAARETDAIHDAIRQTIDR